MISKGSGHQLHFPVAIALYFATLLRNDGTRIIPSLEKHCLNDRLCNIYLPPEITWHRSLPFQGMKKCSGASYSYDVGKSYVVLCTFVQTNPIVIDTTHPLGASLDNVTLGR